VEAGVLMSFAEESSKEFEFVWLLEEDECLMKSMECTESVVALVQERNLETYESRRTVNFVCFNSPFDGTDSFGHGLAQDDYND